MANDPDQFVIHRLRAKPVEYTVKIRHFVGDGKWMMGVTVCDLADTDRNHVSVAADLRYAAEMCEDMDG
jgi:hypothetical protein